MADSELGGDKNCTNIEKDQAELDDYPSDYWCNKPLFL